MTPGFSLILLLLFFILTSSISAPYAPLDTRIRVTQERVFHRYNGKLVFLSRCNPSMFITVFTIAMHKAYFPLTLNNISQIYLSPLPAVTTPSGCSDYPRSSNCPHLWWELWLSALTSTCYLAACPASLVPASCNPSVLANLTNYMSLWPLHLHNPLFWTINKYIIDQC